MNNRQKSGFTLIELMLVMALTGLIAMVAITVFSGSKEKQAVDVEARGLMADLLAVQSQAMNSGLYKENGSGNTHVPFAAIRLFTNRYEVYICPANDDYTQLVSRHTFSNNVVADVAGSYTKIAFDKDGQYSPESGPQNTTLTLHISGVTALDHPELYKDLKIDLAGRIRLCNK